MSELRARIGLSSIEDTLRYNRLRWYGHLERMDITKWPKNILNIDVDGCYPRGRPKKRWMDNIKILRN